MAWNPCPPSRGMGAHHPVEFVPTMAWNTQISWQGGVGGLGLGALAIAGACLAWGIDNNLTRKLSSADPVRSPSSMAWWPGP